MPPLRNIPPVKPVKTERTHEENQERAYIAASRRSDRSLEARVESARRASEIHKRRTGRSLRVTEQDVINEEMYEEEDDDLPLQYRRLTANLQTGSLDFNRKLAAYLTHNVAVRSALNQAINDSFAQQYPGAQQFSHNQNPMFPSPLSTGNLGGSGMVQSPQGTPTSPHPYRQTPYPMPGTPGFRAQPPHKRANSSAVPYHVTGTQSYTNSPVDTQPPSNFRRMSMPAGTAAKPDLKADLLQNSNASAASSPGVSPKQTNGKMGPPQQQQSSSQPLFDLQQSSSLMPLTMTLPPDTQQLIGASLPPNDPFSNILLGGNHPNNFFGMQDYLGNDFYSNGMNTTLAPNAYNMHDSALGTPSDTTQTSQMQNMGDFKGVHYAGNPASGVNTPGEATFDAWINDNWTGETT